MVPQPVIGQAGYLTNTGCFGEGNHEEDRPSNGDYICT